MNSIVKQKKQARSLRTPVIIGWGNELRGDDQAGRAVVEAIRERGLVDAEILDVRQLTPELAAYLRDCDLVIFVDACPAALCGNLCIRSLPARGTKKSSAVGHTGSPEDILDLARTLYDAEPEAWLVSIPAETFEAAEPFSAITEDAVRQAILEVETMVQYVEEPCDADEELYAVE